MSNALIDDLTRALDPSTLCDFEPDPWQFDVLRSFHPRILLNCARQAGKSEIAATLAIHTAIYEPGSTVLLLSPSMRQSTEIFRRCLAIYRRLGRPVVATAENALSLQLDSGSRVISLPGTEATTRGYSKVSLLVVDEAARVEDSIVAAIRPMLSITRPPGRIVALSTPAGERGWWWQAWVSGTEWLKVSADASANPRIDPAFLESEREVLGAELFSQEYECRFLGIGAEQVFHPDDIKNAFKRGVRPSVEIKWR